MSKIVLSPSAGEQLGNGRDLAVALGRLKTVSAMVQQGSIDTENALRDTATGAYLLPYEGSRHFGQNGYLSLPHEYVVNRSGDSERVSQQDPTYSFVALQQGLFSLGRSIFTVYSCRPDVVIAAVPSKKISLHNVLDRQSWIGAAAAAGQVAVIKDREIIGNDGVAGVFSQETMDLFMATSRAAFSIAVEHGSTPNGLSTR